MQPVLLVLQFLLAVSLIAVILLQRTAQDGGGLMGGGNTMGGLFTARGSANLLTRATAILATLFIINSLTLGYLASAEHRSKNLDQMMTSTPAEPGTPATTQTAPMAAAPAKTPEAPKAPAAPEVPIAH